MTYIASVRQTEYSNPRLSDTKTLQAQFTVISHTFLHARTTSKICCVIAQKLLKVLPKKSGRGGRLKLGRT